jgi:hypothetical protein
VLDAAHSAASTARAQDTYIHVRDVQPGQPMRPLLWIPGEVKECAIESFSERAMRLFVDALQQLEEFLAGTFWHS